MGFGVRACQRARVSGWPGLELTTVRVWSESQQRECEQIWSETLPLSVWRTLVCLFNRLSEADSLGAFWEKKQVLFLPCLELLLTTFVWIVLISLAVAHTFCTFMTARLHTYEESLFAVRQCWHSSMYTVSLCMSVRQARLGLTVCFLSLCYCVEYIVCGVFRAAHTWLHISMCEFWVSTLHLVSRCHSHKRRRKGIPTHSGV